MTTLIILSALGLITLFSEIAGYKKIMLPLTFAGLAAALAAVVMDWNTSRHYLNDMMIADNFSLAFTFLMIVITIVWFVLSPDFFHEPSSRIDHFSLIIFALIGAQLLTSFGNMIMLFLGVEILSIPMYILAGSNKRDASSNEAALKYFLMGAFATGFLLFGIALIYGQTGSFNLHQIAAALAAQPGGSVMVAAGILLIITGLAFKVSAVPFHFWAPDVYTGSPTVVTAFMSTVVKTAAFAGFFRLFFTCFNASQNLWVNTLWILSALTIITGNITAVYQRNFKRMLAYSSIAHAGYMLMAIISMGNSYAQQSILFYVVAYSVSSITAFGILLAVSHVTKSDSIDSFNGLAAKNPLLGFITVLAMLSLAGIPPMAGFFAKYYIFTAALQQHYTGLVLIAIFGSLTGVFYYFRIIIAIFKSDETAAVIPMTFPFKTVLLLLSGAALILGIMPQWLAGLL